MSRKTIRSLIAVTVLIVTGLVFAYYIHQNPEVVDQIRHVSVGTFALLFVLYALFVAALAWIQRSTLTLCDLYLKPAESATLTAYSSIINFFGPLQSGPAFRAAYLKRMHDVNLKRYALATLVYYFLYAAVSGVFLLLIVLKWWLLLATLLGVAALLIIALSKRGKGIVERLRGLRLIHVGDLALATLVQVFIQSIIYYVELRSLNASASYLQVLAYTGAANFALFVSLTPGAIGFRESFLVFAQQIHQVSNTNIVTASLIDRGAYISLLAVMAVIVFGFHIHKTLQPKT